LKNSRKTFINDEAFYTVHDDGFIILGKKIYSI